MSKNDKNTPLGYGTVMDAIQLSSPLSNKGAPHLSGASHTALQLMSYQQQQSSTVQPYTPFNLERPSVQSYMRVPTASEEHRPLGSALNCVLIFLAVVMLAAVFVAAGYARLFAPHTEVGSSGTYTVYVIRHAERKYAPIHKCDPPQFPVLPASIGMCEDGENRCGGAYLVEEGLRRSQCIAEKVQFGDLRRIYAHPPGNCLDDLSKREYQTVLPLSMKTGVQIISTYGRGDEKVLGKKLRSQETRTALCVQGSTVVVWDHIRIPKLLKHLGCRQRICEEGLGFYEFDRIFKLTMSCAEGVMEQVQVAYQDCQQPEDSHYNYTPTAYLRG